ncbi:MAG: phosphoribosylglycinamide formyltransferase [Alphaproteobacteria bacterium]|nr:phosphoribosylglycinamide formyltransferase [Alphaproteobacteria bacterium]
MLRVAVLLSGRGSNLQALIDASQGDAFPATIVRVISNVPDAQGLQRAQDAGIDTVVIDHRKFSSRTEFDEALDTALHACDAELVCLAGFMRILTQDFVEGWQDRLINIHPSLLPAFKGLDAQQQALDAGVRIAGCSVHFVRPGMDEGPIVAQAAVPVLQNDDDASLAARILRQEHVIYPLVVRLIAEGRVQVEDEQVVINVGDSSAGILLNPSLADL